METTYYRFLSEIKSFLSQLVKDPLKAKPTQYLKDRDFTKSKIEKILLKRGILERSEKIKTEEGKKPEYNVKYKVKAKDFEKKIHRIYSYYFEKNVPEKQEQEVDEATSCGSVGGAFVQPMAAPIRRQMNIYITEAQFEELRKRLNEEGEGGGAPVGGATTTFSVGANTSRGDMGYDSPRAISIKAKGGKKDPTTTPEGRSPQNDLDSLYKK